MINIPKFYVFGDGNPEIENSIQPNLGLRSWPELEKTEKQVAFQQIVNDGWITEHSRQILITVDYLNYKYLRILPGKRLQKIPPKVGYYGSENDSERMRAAYQDFYDILLSEQSESLVFKMVTRFAQTHIDNFAYNRAEHESDINKQREYIDDAYKNFDRFTHCINHIFEQFCINAVITRNGLIPMQDKRITMEIYSPTLTCLADPKWKGVSRDLENMFSDFREERYPETVTNAHRSVQRFLQILVGEEGKSGKGEVGKLFTEVKQKKLIPIDQLSKAWLESFESYLSSQRANKSTAKPSTQKTTRSDALLVMNTIMVFFQHSLQAR